MKKIIKILLVSTVLMNCEPNEVKLERTISNSVDENTMTDFSVIPEKTINHVEEWTTFNFDITPEQSNADVVYELTFSNQYGEFMIDNTIFKTGQPIKVSKTSFTMKYRALEVTKNDIHLSLKAENGLKIDKKIKYQSIERDKKIPTTFDFTVTPEKNKDYIKDFTTFHFDLNKNGGDKLSYKLSFNGQYGEFLFNDIYYKTGEMINVPQGIFSIKYRPLEITSENLKVVIKASNGVSIEKEIKYESLATNFDFIIAPGHFHSYTYANTAFFKLTILSPPVDDYSIDYNMYYDLDIPLNKSGNFEFYNKKIKENLHSNMFDFNGETYSRVNFNLLGTIMPVKGTITIHIEDENGVKVSKQYDLVWEEFK